MARHFLGFASAGHFVCDWQPHGRGITTLAAAARQERRCLCGSASLPTPHQAELEFKEMEEVIAAERRAAATRAGESLLRRKYVIPFVLACIILACNQATGINSIIAYNTNILLQSGLSDVAAHWGYVVFTLVNFLVTFGGVMLVDRKGRKFLLGVGSAGIIVSLICTGLLFRGGRKTACRCEQGASVHGHFGSATRIALQRCAGGQIAGSVKDRQVSAGRPTSLVVIYSYGDFRAATKAVRSNENGRKAARDHARKLRAGQQGDCVLLESVRRSRCCPRGSAQN